MKTLHWSQIFDISWKTEYREKSWIFHVNIWLNV